MKTADYRRIEFDLQVAARLPLSQLFRTAAMVIVLATWRPSGNLKVELYTPVEDALRENGTTLR